MIVARSFNCKIDGIGILLQKNFAYTPGVMNRIAIAGDGSVDAMDGNRGYPCGIVNRIIKYGFQRMQTDQTVFCNCFDYPVFPYIDFNSKIASFCIIIPGFEATCFRDSAITKIPAKRIVRKWIASNFKGCPHLIARFFRYLNRKITYIRLG
jgi:hypothetical protein